MESLSLETIRANRRTGARPIDIKLVAETGSTNADLLAAAGNLRAPTLLIAENQTAGKGRAGRAWLSEAGASMTFSLAWKFHIPAQALVGLPLAVGTVIAETLTSFGVKARLKWPNDILLGGDKMAGVLIETSGVKGENAIWAIIGIGINVLMPAHLAERIGRPVAAVSTLQERREALLAALLDQLCVALDVFEQHGFKVFDTRWNRLHAYEGMAVDIVDHGALLYRGVAQGVDDQGRLLLATEQGVIAILAGDVSLRSAEV